MSIPYEKGIGNALYNFIRENCNVLLQNITFVIDNYWIYLQHC